MSNVAEVRKLFQDFLAPELREWKTDVGGIQAELSHMERRLRVPSASAVCLKQSSQARKNFL